MLNWVKKNKRTVIVNSIIITLFLIFIFTIEGYAKLTIVNIFPPNTQVAKGFNIQQHGSSAIWIETEGNLTKSTTVFWEGFQLESTVNFEKRAISAIVPEELYATAGKYTIYLLDLNSNVRSNKVPFIVYDLH